MICWGTRTQSDLDLESSIKVGYHGTEQKVGGSLGYTFAEGQSAYVGSNWYDVRLTATASQGGKYASVVESFYGYGNGIGLIQKISPKVKFAETIEDIHMSWNGSNQQQTLFTFNFSLVF